MGGTKKWLEGIVQFGNVGWTQRTKPELRERVEEQSERF
jgi:hypothetical protein